MLIEKLRDRADAIGLQYGITGFADQIIGEGKVAVIEHAIHELAHGMLLGLVQQDQRHLSAAISNDLSRRTPPADPSYDHNQEASWQVTNERRAFTIEWIVIRRLQIPIDWDSIVDAASMQGVSDHDAMQQECDCSWAQQHADAIVKLFGECAT